MIAGILHLMMIGPSMKPLNFPMELLPYTDALFLISGNSTEIFWAIPMALNWNTRWFYAGLIGTIALTSLIALTRIPNEITGMALQDKNPMALLTEVMQTTYVFTTLTIILNKKRASASDTINPISRGYQCNSLLHKLSKSDQGAYSFDSLPSGVYKFTITYPDGVVQTIDNYASMAQHKFFICF